MLSLPREVVLQGCKLRLRDVSLVLLHGNEVEARLNVLAALGVTKDGRHVMLKLGKLELAVAGRVVLLEHLVDDLRRELDAQRLHAGTKFLLDQLARAVRVKVLEVGKDLSLLLLGQTSLLLVGNLLLDHGDLLLNHLLELRHEGGTVLRSGDGKGVVGDVAALDGLLLRGKRGRVRVVLAHTSLDTLKDRQLLLQLLILGALLFLLQPVEPAVERLDCISKLLADTIVNNLVLGLTLCVQGLGALQLSLVNLLELLLNGRGRQFRRVRRALGVHQARRKVVKESLEVERDGKLLSLLTLLVVVKLSEERFHLGQATLTLGCRSKISVVELSNLVVSPGAELLRARLVVGTHAVVQHGQVNELTDTARGNVLAGQEGDGLVPLVNVHNARDFVELEHVLGLEELFNVGDRLAKFEGLAHVAKLVLSVERVVVDQLGTHLVEERKEGKARVPVLGEVLDLVNATVAVDTVVGPQKERLLGVILGSRIGIVVELERLENELEDQTEHLLLVAFHDVLHGDGQLGVGENLVLQVIEGRLDQRLHLELVRLLAILGLLRRNLSTRKHFSKVQQQDTALAVFHNILNRIELAPGSLELLLHISSKNLLLQRHEITGGGECVSHW
mmetsp:Transcript_6971/g.22364  ORF Transcript_6971/g.22364 Transcript_6971/m.22364 type:complete len:619 (+) Transcript_6971:122-1978(+)